MENTDRTGRERSESLGFLNTDLKGSIQAASSLAKTLLCFLTDNSITSSQWHTIITDQKYRPRLTAEVVTLKITAGTQEAQFLQGVCPLTGTPAVVMIKHGSIEQSIQHPRESDADLRTKLDSLFGPLTGEDDSSLPSDIASSAPTSSASKPTTDPNAYIILPSSAGRMRLPTNAYDALQQQTQKWADQKISGDNILRLQLRLLKNIPSLTDAVSTIESRPPGEVPQLSSLHQDRLLSTPATALVLNTSSPSSAATRVASNTSQSESTASGTGASLQTNNTGVRAQQFESRPGSRVYPSASVQQEGSRSTTGTTDGSASPNASTAASTSTPTTTASSQASTPQRTDYLRLQRERQAAERAERDRIKAQIASDRAARRRADEIRRGIEQPAQEDTSPSVNSSTTRFSSNQIRIQVRTYDGTTIRSNFSRNATIFSDVRDWVDNTSKNIVSYNLKWIRAPEPNCNIEASEEEKALSDLGIVGSATFVMVPVKGYVESYASSGGGLVGAVTGAVGGAVGGVLGGLGSLIGWGSSASTQEEENPNETTSQPVPEAKAPTEQKARVRTLADQRAEEAKKRGNELYNGNQLNFQGRGDDDKRGD